MIEKPASHGRIWILVCVTLLPVQIFRTLPTLKRLFINSITACNNLWNPVWTVNCIQVKRKCHIKCRCLNTFYIKCGFWFLTRKLRIYFKQRKSFVSDACIGVTFCLLCRLRGPTPQLNLVVHQVFHRTQNRQPSCNVLSKYFIPYEGSCDYSFAKQRDLYI